MTDACDPAIITGLSHAEAAERLQREGPNELPSARPRSVWTIAFEVVREPMFLLLLLGGSTYLVLGDVHEALVLLAFVLVVMGITFMQERKTERALGALRELSSPRALVIREGHTQRIAGRDVVRGDLIILSEGDRVAADGVVLSATNLAMDESLLTGESATVRKEAADGAQSMAPPSGDARPFVYSGTLTVQGQGIAVVMATGSQTEIGHIGQALRSVKAERTPLQRQTGQLLLTLALIGGALCILVVIVYGITRGNWLNGILVGITLAMAILPDEFAVIMVVFLALGAWRLSQQHVLTRRVPAIETLGAATVLCVDKTGTLTQNRMEVETLYADGAFYHIAGHEQPALPENMHPLLEYAILASERDPFDPMERAFNALGSQCLVQTEHLHHDWIPVREYPLSAQLLAVSHVWQSSSDEHYVVAAKGAPEAIMDLCHLDAPERTRIAQAVQTLAQHGLRILGVARAEEQPRSLPQGQHDFPFSFLGLVGLADPLRPTVPHAVQECREAGIRIVMITGDYPGTAEHIAQQAGFPGTRVITGPELEQMDETTLRQRVRSTDIFARVVPEQKLRLVQALKANGEIVAMTGDGVNDAPALKAAHIGIAMGGRGTDVAREASALVLLDDDFSSIVAAVRMGRRVYANLNKAMAYILAIHIPIAGMTLIPVLFTWPLVLLPVHIAMLHLIIDPASSIAFESEPADANVMSQPPRQPSAPLFTHQAIFFSLLQGGAVLLSVLGVFLYARDSGLGEAEARSMMFTTLLIANLGLIVVNRSWSQTLTQILHIQNVASWAIMAGALLLLGLILYVPILRDLFRFAPLPVSDVLLGVTAGLLATLWFDIVKRLAAHSPRRAYVPRTA
ncbi:MAG TPA: cation-translocating P-type ATPase [Armatimonadota bacterium]|jgi:Ca2+-transporting ATPase